LLVINFLSHILSVLVIIGLSSFSSFLFLSGLSLLFFLCFLFLILSFGLRIFSIIVELGKFFDLLKFRLGLGGDGSVFSEVVLNTVFSFPVVVIGKDSNLIGSTVRGEVTAQSSRKDRNNESDTKSSELNPTLFSSSSLSILEGLESVNKSGVVSIEGDFSGCGRNSSNNSSQDSRHSMKVMYSTGVHESNLFLKPLSEPEETSCGKNTGECTNSHSDSRSNNQVRRRSYRNTSSKGSVKNDFHLELSEVDSGNSNSG